MRNTALAACLAIAAVTAPRPAAAQSEPLDLWGMGGPLFSYGTQGAALGADGGVTMIPQSWVAAVGAFFQMQVGFDGTVRVALGARGYWPLGGVDLGIAFHTGDAHHDVTAGLHLASFLSVGWVSAGYRATIPFQSSPRAWPTEHAFTLSAHYLGSTRDDAPWLTYRVLDPEVVY